MSQLPALDVSSVSLDGVTLIEASAGTGKTHTIASLFVRLLLERGLRVSEILVVTYTRAATAELRQRIRARLVAASAIFAARSAPPDALANPRSGDEVLQALAEASHARGTLSRDRNRLAHAIRSFDQASIFTIHGFCQRVLSVSAFESGTSFEAELLEDQRALLREVVLDFCARRLHAADPLLVEHLRSLDFLEHLQQLARRACSDPELIVVPSGAPAEVSALAERVQRASVEAYELFAPQREQILELLTRPGVLNGTTHNVERVRQWIDELPMLRSWGPLNLPGWIDKFQTTVLVKKTNGPHQHAPPKHAFFDACERLVAARDALRHALDSNWLLLQHELVSYAREQLRERKQQRGVLSFDDLLVQLRDAVRAPSGPALLRRVRELHPAALIDEFQDTDPIQNEIFQRVYDPALPEPGSLFLIGDPKQAIYAFRGADVFAYMDAARRASGAGGNSYTLSVNHRSDPTLVRAVNTIFAGARVPFLFDEIRFQPVTARADARDALGGALQSAAPFEICFVPKSAEQQGRSYQVKVPLTEQVYKLVAGQIVALLNSGATLTTADGETRIEPRHIAVLCRKNAQASAIQEQLRLLGVPTVLDGDNSVFETEMAGELERVLWAMAEPGDARRVRAALTTSVLGGDAAQLLALEAQGDAADQPWDQWLARFHAWHAVWETRGFIQALHALLEDQAVAGRLLTLLDGERRMTDLLHLSELLHTQAMSARLGPLSLLDWYQRARADAAVRGPTAEAAQIRLESDARAVTLTTVHKSKGLDYPIVYCPFLWDDMSLFGYDKKLLRFHDDENARRLTLWIDEHAPQYAEHERRGEQEALAENLRLLYVALTRAKHRVCVTWCEHKDIKTSALAYLMHQPRANNNITLQSVFAKHIGELSAQELLADLHALAERSQGAISIKVYEPSVPASYAESRDRNVALQARTLTRATTLGLRTSSFSRLSTSHADVASVFSEDGRDRDEADAQAEGEGGAPSASPSTVALAAFPAGVTPGHLIHEIYETIDFRAPRDAAVSAQVASLVARYGVDAQHTPALEAAIAASLSTSIDPTGLPSLSVLAPSERLAELEFVFPVAGPHLPVGQWLRASELASVLRRHARTKAEAEYAERVASLGFTPLAGYLRGFMDLVARWNGRYYLLDYKSNHLGERPADYQPARLQVVMARHHYVLQYLLYSVALHRYLALRVPSYDYEQHFGAVYYLFVRGMSPEHVPGTGIFRDRPTRALVDELSCLLAGTGSAP